MPRITRITPAVPAVPSTMIGVGRCLIMSHTLPSDHGAVEYSCENSPPMETPKTLLNTIISTRASRKLGVARPTNPTTVTE